MNHRRRSRGCGVDHSVLRAIPRRPRTSSASSERSASTCSRASPRSRPSSRRGVSAIDLPTGKAEPGELVADVIVAPDEPAWLGLHRADAYHLPYPGGAIPIDVPADAPSRAYAKIEEAIAWRQLPIAAGQVALEIGCAPGGALLALARRGLEVYGVDTADVAPQVLALPNVHHLRTKVGALRFEELPPHVDWLLLDVNLAPQVALHEVARLMPRLKKLRGAVLTLKLNDWAFVDELPRLVERDSRDGLFATSRCGTCRRTAAKSAWSRATCERLRRWGSYSVGSLSCSRLHLDGGGSDRRAPATLRSRAPSNRRRHERSSQRPTGSAALPPTNDDESRRRSTPLEEPTPRRTATERGCQRTDPRGRPHGDAGASARRGPGSERGDEDRREACAKYAPTAAAFKTEISLVGRSGHRNAHRRIDTVDQRRRHPASEAVRRVHPRRVSDARAAAHEDRRRVQVAFESDLKELSRVAEDRARAMRAAIALGVRALELLGGVAQAERRRRIDLDERVVADAQRADPREHGVGRRRAVGAAEDRDRGVERARRDRDAALVVACGTRTRRARRARCPTTGS